MSLLRRTLLASIVATTLVSGGGALGVSRVARADEPPASPAPVVTWGASPSASSASPTAPAASAAPPPSSSSSNSARALPTLSGTTNGAEGSGASTTVPSPATQAAAGAPVVASSRAATPRGTGAAVLATDGATDAAWRLASRLYRGPLRPNGLDEAHARALAGEAPAATAPRDVEDLYETRGAVRGEDAPSRRLLASLADTLGVEAIIVVSKDTLGVATARVYLASNGAFDAARYTEEASPAGPASSGGASSGPGSASNEGAGTWDGTVASLERTLRADSRVPRTGAAPVIASASKEAAPPADTSRPFYKSPWFWGALGAAVFGGGAIYLATQNNSDDGGSMHVQLKVPR